jgi:hypothetical protein
MKINFTSIFKEGSMKRLILLFLIIGATLSFFGCSEKNPSAPELNQGDQVTTSLNKNEHTPFNGTSTSILPPVDFGKKTVLPNGRVQVRGFIIDTEDIMNDDRVTGTVRWVVHWNEYYTEEGEFIYDKRWGTGELIIPDVGRWDMTYKGWANVEEGVTYEVDGHGKGELRGLKAHWIYKKPLAPGPFNVTGYIVEK